MWLLRRTLFCTVSVVAFAHTRQYLADRGVSVKGLLPLYRLLPESGLPEWLLPVAFVVVGAALPLLARLRPLYGPFTVLLDVGHLLALYWLTVCRVRMYLLNVLEPSLPVFYDNPHRVW
jgi:hypothetical protein